MAAGGAAVYHAGKSRGANQEAAAQDAASQDAYEQPAAPPPPPAPTPGGMSQSTIDELKQLGQLHDQGVLTDEEFAAQKAKVLNG